MKENEIKGINMENLIIPRKKTEGSVQREGKEGEKERKKEGGDERIDKEKTTKARQQHKQLRNYKETKIRKGKRIMTEKEDGKQGRSN